MNPPLPDAAAIVSALESAGARAVLVAAGGGSEAISHLVTCPGATSFHNSSTMVPWSVSMVAVGNPDDPCFLLMLT